MGSDVVEKALSTSFKDFNKNFWKYFKGMLIVIGIVILPLIFPFIYLIPYFLSNGLNLEPLFHPAFYSYGFLTLLILSILSSLILAVSFDFGYKYFLLSPDKKYLRIFEGVGKFFWRAVGFLLLVIFIGISLVLITIGTVFIANLNIIIFLILFFIELTASLLFLYFAYFWTESIVIYDTGVIEGLKISYRKTKNNVYGVALLMVVAFFISSIPSGVEYVSTTGSTASIILLIITYGLMLFLRIVVSIYIKLLKLDGCMLLKEEKKRKQ